MVAQRPLVYLACPYSDTDPAIREIRFRRANGAAAELMRAGFEVFSPISMCHPIAEQCELPKGFEFWEKLDRAYLSVSRRLYVLTIPGWHESKGVQAETAIATDQGIPVVMLPDDFGSPV